MVRVIGAEGDQLGVMPLFQAHAVAKKSGGELIEIAGAANPPVWRVFVKPS